MVKAIAGGKIFASLFLSEQRAEKKPCFQQLFDRCRWPNINTIVGKPFQMLQMSARSA